jgi:RNA polymerase subunit RPABC4/transcription elongation factor Spt4
VDNRFYYAPGLDVERVVIELENMFVAQGYQVQHFGNKQQMTVQFKQGSDLEALIGLQAALTLTLFSYPDGVAAVVGQQQWVDKAVVGAVGIFLFWPLMITAGAGVLRQAQIESQLLNSLDIVMRHQKSDVQMGPVPPQYMSQMQQQATPPPSFFGGVPPWQQPGGAPQAAQFPCPNCKGLNEVGDSYCSYCGKPLTAQKKICPECKAELKPDAAFCPRCGTQVPASS